MHVLFPWPTLLEYGAITSHQDVNKQQQQKDTAFNNVPLDLAFQSDP